MILLFITFFIIVTFFLIGWTLSTTPYKGPKSDHFDGKRFLNTSGAQAKGFKELFKWMRSRERGPWQWKSGEVRVIPEPKSNPATSIYFINHSSFLIQTGGYNILTDPVFSKRVSPFSFAGPKRMQPPGIAFDDLPPIDLVLISHNHYDHLDIRYVKKIQQTWNPDFVVPLGVKSFLKRNRIPKVTELDWWENVNLFDIKITATEAQHFSGRGMFDRDQSLWCGFSIKTHQLHIQYIGDTGFGDFFQRFPEKIGAPDLAIIPIGAFKPIWFMQPIHCSPTEALKIHQIIGAKKSIACHFGTFPLADDGMDEPEEELKKKLSFEDLPDHTFRILANGGHVELK
jgi:L-ascorbate metabolism protein UlaG (beta-lactamase superfamily)